MSAFKDMVEADNKGVFLNMDEFGEKHNLNGADCQCILQNSAAVQALSIGEGMHKTYPELYGDDLVVNVEAGDLPEIPVYGQLFSVDDKNYLVDTVKEDMGMLTIGLVANER